MKVAILHGYSARNSGDGLLLEEAIELVRGSICAEAEITIVASYPETFAFEGVRFVRSRPGRFGFDPAYLRFLARLRQFDLVIAVGGGYLRFKNRSETLKTGIVHLPQLTAASLLARRSVYLPQSIGPAPRAIRPLVRHLAKGVDLFYVRDDRSLGEFTGAGLRRKPDMALLSAGKHPRVTGEIDPIPVYSIRPVNGAVPPPLIALARLLDPFTGYIQSTGAGNDDTAAMQSVGARDFISRTGLLDREGSRRVVVAVRLHAALMALNAGHYVIHLAYERKGFGAFADLGLTDYVFNVNCFSPERIAHLTRQLLDDEIVRADYDARVNHANTQFAGERAGLIADIEQLLASGPAAR